MSVKRIYVEKKPEFAVRAKRTVRRLGCNTQVMRLLVLELGLVAAGGLDPELHIPTCDEIDRSGRIFGVVVVLAHETILGDQQEHLDTIALGSVAVLHGTFCDDLLGRGIIGELDILDPDKRSHLEILGITAFGNLELLCQRIEVVVLVRLDPIISGENEIVGI